jgi:hypothetical protein
MLIYLFRVFIYRFKFLTNDRFDNKFITADFLDIDLQRIKHNQDTALPLNAREKKKYIMVILIGTIYYSFLI